MLAPVIIQYFIFTYIPMYGITIAFKDYYIMKGVFKSPWVGLDNFQALFSGRDFLNDLRNTVLISSYKFVAGFPGPIILALLLNEVKNFHFKRVVQTISYLPHFLSWIVLSGILIEVLSPSRGIVNAIISAFGIEPIYFIGDPKIFRFTLVATALWKEIGWGSIIYLAAITNIDPQLYEAAVIDGAKRFKQIIYITLPSIAPVVVIMLILSAGSLISDDFEQVFNLINPGVSGVGETLSIYTYIKGIRGMGYSYGTAVGLFTSIISLMLIVITNLISKKFTDYGIW